MLNKTLRLNNYTGDIENICTLLIEKELDMFFKACIKTAYAFSCMVSKDLKNYTRYTFERLVLSEDELNIFLEDLSYKLKSEITKYTNYDDFDGINVIINREDYTHNIENNIKTLEITQGIIKISEKAIDTALSKILDGLFMNHTASYILSKAKISQKILGSNSSRGQVERYQDKLFRQIEGGLINMKLNIRDQFITSIISIINKIPQNDNKDFMIA